ncbi:hypothetical protein Ciccas_001704 [Cichlidogyrus casuarinus]|uniref:Uncharacterized protein n=1 Tax=Cichlidogyrus casuarinus TaxID=1844966 RepID=A0ABD2QJA6_9PLAT
MESVRNMIERVKYNRNSSTDLGLHDEDMKRLADLVQKVKRDEINKGKMPPKISEAEQNFENRAMREAEAMLNNHKNRQTTIPWQVDMADGLTKEGHVTRKIENDFDSQKLTGDSCEDMKTFESRMMSEKRKLMVSSLILSIINLAKLQANVGLR